MAHSKKKKKKKYEPPEPGRGDKAYALVEAAAGAVPIPFFGEAARFVIYCAHRVRSRQRRCEPREARDRAWRILRDGHGDGLALVSPRHGEERTVQVGPIAGRLYVAVVTYRDAVTRVISRRKANSREERLYAQATRA